MGEQSVADIPDDELLRRVVSRACSKARNSDYAAWAHVKDVTTLGSTYSAQLCRRFGFDPETGNPAPKVTHD